MIPDYEVKLLLDPALVLGPDHKLSHAIRSTFDMPSSSTKMNIQFLDNENKDIYNAGWTPRIRKTEGKDQIELTYKKRYAIPSGDIDAIVETANVHGFDSSDAAFEAQVEWGYQKKTLSISRKRIAPEAGKSGMDLPGLRDSIALLMNDPPRKFNDWGSPNWGIDTLATCRIYGPVMAKRWIGKWNGTKIYVEVWPILNADRTGDEYIVEASFKEKTRAAAASKQQDLLALVQKKGWFLPEDSLKTQIIMDRY